MTLFPLFMSSYLVAGTVSNCLGLATNIFVAVQVYKDADFKLIVLPLCGYFLTSYIFISLALEQSDSRLQIYLGIFLFVIALYFMFINNNIKIKPTKLNGFLAGALGGAIGGFFGGGGGPPVVVYFMATTPSVKKYFATVQTYFMIGSMYSVATRASKGLVTAEVMSYWVIGVIAIIIGLAIGKKMRGKMDDELVKKLVYCYIGISGLILVFSA